MKISTGSMICILCCSLDCDALRNGDDGGDTVGDGVDGRPSGYLLGITE